jgi:hypothetical protein
VAPLVVERRGAVYAALSTFLLVVLLWGPFEATRSLLGALVFIALAAAGTYLLDRQIRAEEPGAPV